MPVFSRVQIVPINEPPLAMGRAYRQWATDYCAAAVRAGVTELQVNFLATPMHPILCENPTKVYHWFSHYAPSLDQFVSSSLFRGVYPTPLLAANFERMSVLAEEAVAAGLRPFLYCAEPRFVPERFFHARPDLRGPRVDNPVHGGTPYYALCTDKAEVRAHYQAMLRQVLTAIPQLTTLSLFTTDSGSGFCYNPDLYAGANGPGHCRRIPLIDRIVTFVQALIAAGRETNPAFEVHINSNLPPEFRAELAARQVDGLCLPVYGWYSWTGGLEDQWAYHQYQSRLTSIGYDQARTERVADIQARVEAVRVHETAPWAICCLPTEQYFLPLRYVPQPYEILRILRTYRDLGVQNLSLRGLMNTEAQVRYDINAAVLPAFQADPTADDATLLGRILAAWDVMPVAETLRSAWALADAAVQQRPLWNHGFGREEHLVVGPLVPDPTRVSRAERAYYDHQCFDELYDIKGDLYYLPNLGSAHEYTYALDKYRTHTLPRLEAACAQLMTAVAMADVQSQAVLAEQHHFLAILLSHLRSQWHWVRMAALMRGVPTGDDPAAIVQEEIANTEVLLALLADHPARSLALGAVKGRMYELDPEIVEQLRARVAVMAAHQPDPVLPLDPEAGWVMVSAELAELTAEGGTR